MTLKAVAQELASKGRGPDTLLVHMTEGEVAGLEALARRHYGQGLTINPDTGLPEAGILRSILPIVAGIALTATGIGAPMAAAIVGGGTALATGSLQQGLMAGLGAYGGAGMGSALSSMGTAAASAAPSAAAQIGSTAAPVGEVASAFGDTAMANGFETGFEGFVGGGPSAASYVPWEAGFPVTDTAASTAAMSPWDKMSGGISNLTKPGGFDRFVQAQGGGMGAMKNGMLAMQGLSAFPDKFKDAEDDSQIRPYSYDQGTQTFTPGTPYPAREAPRRFAGGGVASLMGDWRAAYPISTSPLEDTGSDSQFVPGVSNPAGSPHASPTMRNYNYDPTTQVFTLVPPAAQADPAAAAAYIGMNTFGGGGPGVGSDGNDGGAAAAAGDADGSGPSGSDGSAGPGTSGTGDDGGPGGVGGWAGGGITGLLQGPGDGVSDSIPASINGREPAALSGGEFVVPARIVSELGNGSTDAGARKLYAMMDRIQQQRSKTTGRGRVAANTRADRMMPA